MLFTVIFLSVNALVPEQASCMVSNVRHMDGMQYSGFAFLMPWAS